MTQLGEMIAVGVMKLESSDCPFDHEQGKPPEVKNEFKGSGTTLGASLISANSTVTYKNNVRSAPEAVPYPALPPLGSKPVCIDGFNYPVTCAAHHLIPAAGSLKHASALLEWLDKDEGLVWANAGYDVDGAENGTWLPGNYAVGGNGTGEWMQALSVLPDDEHASAPVLPKIPAPPAGVSLLVGHLHDFDEGRKGEYVLQATELYKAQFHDAHRPYNELVQSTLQELGLKYQKKYPHAVAFCAECKQTADKRKKLGLPTPFRIVHQLNSISRKLRSYLVGARGHATVYTSRWGMQAERKGLARIR